MNPENPATDTPPAPLPPPPIVLPPEVIPFAPALPKWNVKDADMADHYVSGRGEQDDGTLLIYDRDFRLQAMFANPVFAVRLS